MIMQTVVILSVLAVIAILLIEAFSNPAIPHGQALADYITDRNKAALAYGRALRGAKQAWNSYVFHVGKRGEKQAYSVWAEKRARLVQVRANCYDLGIAIK